MSGVLDEERSSLPSRPSAGRRILQLFAGTAVIAFLAWAVWWTARPAVDPVLITPIQTAMQSVSNRDAFVLPGTELTLRNPETFSSEPPDENEPARLALLNLLDDYQRRPNDQAAVWLLGGFVATGQLHAADDLARTAVGKYPRNPKVKTLAAVTAYRLERGDQARQLLEEVVATHPGYVTARLNLTVLMKESGETALAAQIWPPSLRLQLIGPMRERLNRLLAAE